MPAARLMNRVAHRRREKDGRLYSDKGCAGLPDLTELATSAHGRLLRAGPVVSQCFRTEATEESASEQELSTPLQQEKIKVDSTADVSGHVAEAEQQSRPGVGTETNDAAETAEFQTAGNVNARRMELPGKLLSGKASGLLRSGRNRSQGEQK